MEIVFKLLQNALIISQLENTSNSDWILKQSKPRKYLLENNN